MLTKQMRALELFLEACGYRINPEGLEYALRIREFYPNMMKSDELEGLDQWMNAFRRLFFGENTD